MVLTEVSKEDVSYPDFTAEDIDKVVKHMLFVPKYRAGIYKDIGNVIWFVMSCVLITIVMPKCKGINVVTCPLLICGSVKALIYFFLMSLDMKKCKKENKFWNNEDLTCLQLMGVRKGISELAEFRRKVYKAEFAGYDCKVYWSEPSNSLVVMYWRDNKLITIESPSNILKADKDEIRDINKISPSLCLEDIMKELEILDIEEA